MTSGTLSGGCRFFMTVMKVKSSGGIFRRSFLLWFEGPSSLPPGGGVDDHQGDVDGDGHAER